MTTNSARLVYQCILLAICLFASLPLISCDKPQTTPPAAPPTHAPTTTVPGVIPSPERTVLSEQDKIERMLSALTASDAVFIRGGSEYTGKEAASHLRMKWNAAGDRVQTAQQFIDLLASSSSASGKPYSIRAVDGRVAPSREWFTALLASIESGADQSTTTPTPPSAQSPDAAANKPAPSAHTPMSVLEILRASKNTFIIVEDDENEKHSGATMSARIGLKYALAGRPKLTAEAFIDSYCTRSTRHNTEYLVRNADGSTTTLAAWLRAQLTTETPTSGDTP